MSKKSFFSNIIEARQRQANRYVRGYLMTFDDATLKAYGYKRENLAQKGTVNYPL